MGKHVMKGSKIKRATTGKSFVSSCNSLKAQYVSSTEGMSASVTDPNADCYSNMTMCSPTTMSSDRVNNPFGHFKSPMLNYNTPIYSSDGYEIETDEDRMCDGLYLQRSMTLQPPQHQSYNHLYDENDNVEYSGSSSQSTHI